MRGMIYFRILLSLMIVACCMGLLSLAKSDIDLTVQGRSQNSVGQEKQHRIVRTDREGQEVGKDQMERRGALDLVADVIVDHGDTLISDEHVSFMDRGLRAYQDLIDVDPGSKNFDTYVNVVYGSLIHIRRDIYIPGRGLPLQIVFTYNSGSFFDGRYGFGWQMNYNVRYVTNTANENVIIVRPCDRTDIFLKRPDGSFRATYGVRDSLVALSQGYKLTVWQDTRNDVGDYVVYSFNSPDHHYVTKMEDRNGNTLSFTYNDDKQLATVTDGSGRNLNLTYTDNKLIKITDHSGREFNYAYDSNGDMIEVTDPLGGTVSYTYSQDCHDCLSITNANGNTTQFNYDTNFALSTVTDPLDNTSFTFSYEWTQSGNTNVADANGNTTMYTYDGNDRVVAIADALGNTTTRTWDDNYNMTSVTDANGNSTIYSYDFRGNLFIITDALGNTTISSWEYTFNKRTSMTDANGNTTTYGYDTNGNLIDITTPCCNTTHTYDSQGQMLSTTNGLGHTTSYEYDDFGNRNRITDALGNENIFTYDAIGNMLSETDANGNMTTYSYDALNRLTGTTDGLGYTENHSYDPVGNRLSDTDKNGNTSTYTYDALNRLLGVTDALEFTESYSYDPIGNRIGYTDKNENATTYTYDPLNRLIGVSDPLGFTESYTFDAVGNRIIYEDKNGNTSMYTYDVMNQLISATDVLGNTENYSYDYLGNRVSYTDQNGNATMYTYDGMNRLTGITDPLGYTEENTYDAAGNKTDYTDKNGNTVSYGYDPLNRLTHVTDGLGNTIIYSYDPAGNILSRCDANGSIWQYEYDASNKCTKEISPLGNETSYSYDGVGNRINRTDPNDLATLYQYDSLDRMINVSYQNGDQIDYEYDPVGNVLRMIHTGGLGDVTERTYDALNRLISETLSNSSFTKSVSYSYDGVGNILSLTDPDGEVLTYECDAANRLIRVTDSYGNVTTKEYDGVGNETSVYFSDSTWSVFEYDDGNRLTLITTKVGNDAVLKKDGDDAVLFEYEYTYDAFGQVLEVTKNGLNEASFQYNSANWLTDASYSTGQDIQYTYDQAGNRLAEEDHGNVTSYTHNAEGKLSIQMFPDGGTIQYSYDNNNHVIQTSSSLGIVNYEYDQENRLKKIAYPPPYGTISNYYSPEGQRLARNERGTSTYYYPTLFGNVVEMDAGGNTTTRINPDISFTRGNETKNIHWDAFGNTSHFTDKSITESFIFDSYGTMLSASGDPENVHSALYASLMKVDWDSYFGGEFADGDFMPSINQRFGGKLLNWKQVKRHKGLCDELIQSKRYYDVVCKVLRPRYYNRLMRIPKVVAAVQGTLNCRHWQEFGLPKLALQILICCPQSSGPAGSTQPPSRAGAPLGGGQRYSKTGTGRVGRMDCGRISFTVYQQAGKYLIDIVGSAGAVPPYNKVRADIAWARTIWIVNTNNLGAFMRRGELLKQFKQPFFVDVWYQDPFSLAQIGPCRIQ